MKRKIWHLSFEIEIHCRNDLVEEIRTVAEKCSEDIKIRFKQLQNYHEIALKKASKLFHVSKMSQILDLIDNYPYQIQNFQKSMQKISERNFFNAIR